MPSQLLTQSPTALDEEAEVDRLVGYLHVGILGVLDLQESRDLLWRPAKLEPGFDLGPQPRAQRQLARLGAPASSKSCLFGLSRPISDSSSIASHLT